MKFRYEGVEFGGLGDILVQEFDPGSPDLRGDDTERPQGDGIIPGRQFFGARVWAFDMATNRRNLRQALETASSLESVWTDPALRLQAFTRRPLSYLLDGRWRRVYGRPGRFQGPHGNNRAKGGGAPITADFKVMDPLYYDEEVSTARLTIVPASVGGLVSPLVAPLSSVGSGSARAGLVVNRGNAATPLRATFHGPISNPRVLSSEGWEIGLDGTLAYDVSVTVDPLEGTVFRQDGVPIGGMLTNATRLNGSRLPKGQSELSFTGIDPTGTATVDLSWRNAYTSI